MKKIFITVGLLALLSAFSNASFANSEWSSDIQSDWGHGGGHDGWHGPGHGGPGHGPGPGYPPPHHPGYPGGPGHGPGPGYPPPPPPNYPPPPPPPHYPPPPAPYPGNPGYPGGGYTQNIYQSVNREFVGDNLVPLANIFPVYNFRGYRIRAVMITASSRFGHGQMSWMSARSGSSYSQTVSQYSSQYYFSGFDEFIDTNWQQAIQLRGDIFIESITVQIVN